MKVTPIINEAVDTEKIKKIVNQVFKMAEEQAFEQSSKGERAVTGDQVSKNVDAMLKAIEDAVSQKVRQEYT